MELLPALSEQSIVDLVTHALEKNVPVESLERILTMRRELKEEYSKEAFFRALAGFQSKCPTIEKKKKGTVAKYAPLEDVMEDVKPLMLEFGFSCMVTSETFADRITAYCKIIHVEGHSETVSFTAHHLVQNKAISAAQLDAGTFNFARRQAFCSAFNLVTRDEDVDGKGGSVSTDELSMIRELLSQLDVSEEKLLTKLGVGDLLDLSRTKALGLIRQLRQMVANNNKGN